MGAAHAVCPDGEAEEESDDESTGNESSSSDSSSNAEQEKCGTDDICDAWYWGHADSKTQPPPSVPFGVGVKTLPLRMMPDADFHQQFAEYVLCPHFLDKQAQGAAKGQGCPFMGGTAFLRHADVSKSLSEVPALHVSGAIERKNELGYLKLQAETFPMTGSLGLGNSVDMHRRQRRWLEELLAPSRLPGRPQWRQEAQAFLDQKRAERKFKFRRDVSLWWQQMLWKFVLGDTLSDDEAGAVLKFQSAWLQGAVKSGPNTFVDAHPVLVPAKASAKIWPLSRLIEEQASYRERIKAKLPSGVLAEDRDAVAQGVLEMFIFAGGLSVPLTIHCAVSVLFRHDLLPGPIIVNEAFVEPFVYEVTRLFPAVQGFCYWQKDHRQVLSLNAAMRDPAVWGSDANRFTIKPVELYRQNHVGFANQAVSAPGTFDSKACPGRQMTLEAVQGFVLAIGNWQPTRIPKAMVWWQPIKVPKPAGVHKKWFNDFTLEVQDWLDGDMTGENLLRQLQPIELVRLLRKIGMSDPEDGFLAGLIGKMGPSRDREAGVKVSACDHSTRLFFELSRKRFKELADRAGSGEPNEAPAGPFSRYFDLNFNGASPTIRLPVGDTFKKKVRDSITNILGDILKNSINDDINELLKVKTLHQRQAAIMLCQQAFQRTGGEVPPPHSTARPDSYLPKPSCAFFDITSDDAQAAIARCGMGQLYLRGNTEPHLLQYGDVLCDASALAELRVRPAFEKLGAIAVFQQVGNTWRLTAMDWKHGGKVVKPGDAQWEHAKWVWRCSLITHITTVHHLVQMHWIVANALVSSPRLSLGPFHPIRRLLQVFTYNTPSINHNSALSLFPESGMLHRMSCFPYEELRKAFVGGAEGYKFQTFPQEYQAVSLPEAVKSRLPIFQDGLEVYGAFHDFMAGYVSIYYLDDASVLADAALKEYWKFPLTEQYAKALPALSRKSLIDQLARGAFDVTAYHELVGYVVAYTTDPAGAALQVRPDLDTADLQQFIAVNSLVAGTGTPMPMLMASGMSGDEDWLHQLDLTAKGGHEPGKFQKVATLYRSLMNRFDQISQSIARRNAPGAGREIPCTSMDPRAMERSVSL